MRKKLIEVALPLEAINEESSRRKRKAPAGYPTTLHKWWAQRPLAACRAVLFAQLVDDPSSRPDEFPTEEAQEAERERLFEIIRNLIKWENSNNERLLATARAEILKSTGDNPPPVLDPFCGGGSIPLEAQRLGLNVRASDLNPVAVLITKALIEIPPKFTECPPVHPLKNKNLIASKWRGTYGLAEDVRYYGQWIHDEAEKLIGSLYPKVKLPAEHGGGEAMVVAWLWARTVKCPNPACEARMPMVRSFWLSQKKGRSAYAHPILDRETKTVRFEIRTEGTPEKETTNRTSARCLFCTKTIKKPQLREVATQHGIQEIPLAVVCKTSSGRIYLPFEANDIPSIERPEVTTVEQPITNDRRWFSPPLYGVPNYSDLFTSRQLVALMTISDLVAKVRERVLADARSAGINNDGKGISREAGPAAYADAVVTYLAFANNRAADYNSAVATWRAKDNAMRSSFSKQALPMVWDFAEANPFASSSAGFLDCCKVVAKCIEFLPANFPGTSLQRDARASVERVNDAIFCTDPPYYDNIGYADLSDFFYLWLRRSLSSVYPGLFTTLLVPKREELIAAPARFDGDKEAAKRFFEEGFEHTFGRMRVAQHPDFPLTVYYAFKQTEDESDDETDDEAVLASTGWETLLEGLIRAGFTVTGTWPMRTEGDNRQVGIGTNALASSIVLVCRPRQDNAPVATRRQLINELRQELPDALKKLQHGNVAPVDLAQATIGPGIAIFSRYARVLEADGKPMSVRTALQVINQELDAYLVAQEGESDRDTRFCLAWFEQYGMNEASFGEADVLARAKGTAVDGLVKAGVVHSKAGKVRLLKRAEYPEQWNPGLDHRVTVWECAQHLIRRLHADTGGIEAAAKLLNELGSASEDARALAYRLYSICERKKWAEEALAYNTLVVEWPAIQDKAAQQRVMPTTQADLFS